MGYEFDENGKYVGWSDLFDYSGIEELKASEYLPMPNGVTYSLKQDDNAIDISTYASIISQYIDQIDKVHLILSKIPQDNKDAINKYTKKLHQLKAAKIRAEALLLRYLFDKKSTNVNGTEYMYLKWDENISHTNAILNDLNLHSKTVISPIKLEKCLKNSISSSITNIIQDLRNMDLAYTSIVMTDFRNAALHTKKGSKSEKMTLVNPLTKFVMQEQNMTGKEVIGIAAVGEKVFFNLSYYWNEGLRSGSRDWINNLRFHRQFERIEGRSKGLMQPVVKKRLANVNFENIEEDLRETFESLPDVIDDLLKKYELKKEDYDLQTDKFKQYKQELINAVHRSQEIDVYADDLISQLLSAATDNAKELILAKINAGSNLARCYLHLIMMGFDLNDIVSFMTSDAVTLVNDLSNANMYDEYMFKISVDDAIKICLGYFPISKFLYGVEKNTDYEDYEAPSTVEVRTKAFNMLHLALEKALQDTGKTIIVNRGTDALKEVPITYKVENFSSMIHDYFECRINNSITKSLSEFIRAEGISLASNGLRMLSDYIDNIINKIKSTDVIQFNLDLAEFDNVYKLATETSTLGSSFLGLNQGIPTSKAELVDKVIKILQAVSNREKNLGLSVKSILACLDDESDPYKKKYIDQVVKKILNNNVTINPSTVRPILHNAKRLGILGDFDIFKWIDNKDGYRKATSDYYNLIKGTWNIFDIIDKLPHFESIFQTFKTVLTFDKALIKKSLILNMVIKDLFGNYGYVNPDIINKLISYVDDLLLIRLINNYQIQFPISKGDPYLLSNWKEIKYNGENTYITLNTGSERATFKKLFEEKLVPMLQAGYCIDENGNRQDISNNRFIKNLDIGVDHDQKFLKLNLDMLNISGTAENETKYQECLTDLIKLKNIKYGGKSLTDWFMIYNLFINRNLFGSERLTTIFAPFIELLDDDSFIKNILKEIGEYDFRELGNISDKDYLKSLGYHRDDALYKIAPTVTVAQEPNENAIIVKEKLEGVPVYKRKRPDGSYGKALLIIADSNEKFADVKEMKIDLLNRLRNYINYSVISTPFADNEVSNETNLMSDDVSLIMDALQTYIRQGILIIYTENC